MLCDKCYYCSKCKTNEATARKVVSKEGKTLYQGSICETCIKQLIKATQQRHSMESSNPGIQTGEIHYKRCNVCEEWVKSSFENFSDHDCHKTHLEKHLVPNFPEDESRAKFFIDNRCCLFCQEQFEKTIEEKTKCRYCKEFLYEKPKKADCQMRHELFQKYFPNYKLGERKGEGQAGKKNYWPWIIGSGLVGAGVIAGLIYYFWNKKEPSE